jgi:catechol-2,3-dioxygenase
MKTTVRGVRSVDIDMSQPERAAAFYKSVWNLTEVERCDGSIYFRGTGPFHHILAIHPAPKGFAIAASPSMPPARTSSIRCTRR